MPCGPAVLRLWDVIGKTANDEFVAAKSCDRGAGRHAFEHFVGGCDQEVVAGEVAVSVVDLLELVEIGDEHGENACTSSTAVGAGA